jgi:arylsulfatase B
MGGQGTTDLWCTDKPCYGINNTDYNGFIFTRESVRIIEAHDPAVPLFMYIALQNNHEPLEVPAEYMDQYPADMYWDQRIMNAMSSFWDEAVGNITGALKRTGMWNNTLYVLSGDNGGPVYWTATPAYPHGGSANNYPLRAGKSSLFEGGVRVSAFASGGFLPVAMRGKTLGKTSQAIHMADWFHTFSSLAGVDWLDEPPNLPSNRDSIDVWPLISGATAISPRTEVPLAVEGTLSDLSGNTLEPGYPQHDSFNGSALIVGAHIHKTFYLQRFAGNVGFCHDTLLRRGYTPRHASSRRTVKKTRFKDSEGKRAMN